jgi:acetylornithine deacetylase
MTAPDISKRLREAVDVGWDDEVDWLGNLVRFASRRGQEGPCQDWLAREFAGRGWSVDRYTLTDIPSDGVPQWAPVVETDYANAVQVVAAYRSTSQKGRSLILQGHVDVVPEGPVSMWAEPPFEPVIKDGWMVGRGSCDMKGGVACMVFALDAIRAAGLRPTGDIYVQTVTEEESTGNGALSTLLRGYRADACLIAEPTNGHLTRAHTGTLWFRLKVNGQPSHLGGPHGSNAIVSTYQLISALQDLTDELNREASTDRWYAEVDRPIRFNPGRIRGGDWPSAVPAWCEVDCRLGVLPGTPSEKARRRVIDTVAAAAKSDPFLADHPPQLIWTGFQADGYVLEPGTEAENVLAGAHKAVRDEEMEALCATALNDTRYYGLYYGIPGLCYGPRGEKLHAFNERVDLVSVKETTLVIAQFIAEWCGLESLDVQK